MFTIYDLYTVAGFVAAAVIAKYGVDLLCSRKSFLNKKIRIFSLSRERDLFYCPGDEEVDDLKRIKD